MRNITEVPENWVILKIDGNETYYRVFAGWRGGYTGSDSWKINSGIVSIESDEDYYYFIGHSGSCYKCHKRSYGNLSSWVSGVLNGIIKNSKIPIEILNKDYNFEEL